MKRLILCALRGVLLGAVTVGAVVAQALPASADAGFQVLVQAWDPRNPNSGTAQSVFDDAHFFDTQIAAVWSKARDPICTAIKAQIAQANPLAKGVSLYNVDCSMGSSAIVSISQPKGSTNRFAFSFKVSGNSLTATSTQPTPFGNSLDPRFSITYELDADVDVSVLPFTANSVKVAISGASLDSHNFAADVLKAVDDFLSLGFRQRAEQAIDQSKSLNVSTINSALAKANGPLMQYAPKYSYSAFWWAHNKIIADFAPVLPSTPRPASVRGTIRWSKASRITITDCSHFVMGATSQAGPAPLTYPYGVYGDAPTVAGVGQFVASGPPRDAGDHFECSYTLAQLPEALPERFTAVAKGAGPITGGNAIIGYYLLTMHPQGGWQNDGGPVFGTPTGFDWEVTVGHTSGTGLQKVVLFNKPGGDPALRLNLLVSGGPYDRGLVLAHSGDFNGAAAHFTSWLRAHPSDATALYNLGLIQLQQGQISQAQTNLTQASKLARAAGDAALLAKIDAQLKALAGPQH
jgi:hypothetical protein